MAQPGEARPAAHAHVATIQKWIVGVAIGCMALAVFALAAAVHQPHRAPFVPWPASHWILLGIGMLFGGLSLLGVFVGRGLLILLWPRDVEGELRSAAERTRHPRLYGLAMMWSGIVFLLALVLLEVQISQASILNNLTASDAIYGLFAASMLPISALEVYGWWRRHTQHRMAE